SMTETEIIIITRTDDEEELTEEELTEGETDIEIIEEEAFPAFDPNARKLDLPAFDAFPNPTDGLLMLQFEAVPGELDIRVTDLNGQQIYKEQMRNFEGIYNKQIDLRDVSKGAYLLTIRQKGQVFSRKILVQ
ncbi:MAG: T9SS type A sorting domain-containing protein, partial [Bacteroidota bacterium]